MRLLVFGATGKTGGLVVDAALAKGHEVTVLVRDPAKFTKPGVRVVAGDATRSADVQAAMRGQQAVVEAIGGTTPYKATTLESTSVRNIVSAMQTEGVRRLIVVSMMGLGDSRAQAPFWYRFLLMTTFLRGSTPDKANMEAIVRASGLNYTIARPPILKDEPATGDVKVLAPGVTGHSINRADLANFLVDQIESERYVGRAVTVVNH
ncbi:Putative NADH-flavin reductase [Granulicella rosea]|uniref:Putative NADH-flavin reductase n=1 Tax=Granulicella rosea TaxID=474952 RepID=A0A239LRT6_9BACT|nr:SDR family oxidoreductase [Granulicella rosea]SNT33151.1 Putative NADH-flavin reductase [Granulicella rosea]